MSDAGEMDQSDKAVVLRTEEALTTRRKQLEEAGARWNTEGDEVARLNVVVEELELLLQRMGVRKRRYNMTPEGITAKREKMREYWRKRKQGGTYA